MPLFKKPTLHVILFAVSPVLTLFASNIREMEPMGIVRPLLVSAVLFTLIYLLARLLTRNWTSAAVFTTLSSVIFYSFGHIQRSLADLNGLGMELARNRVMMPLALLLFFLLIYFFVIRKKIPTQWNLPLNLIGVLLVFSSAVQIGIFSLRQTAIKETQSILSTELATSTATKTPDVYYIILDMYSRQDELLHTYQFDNSPFINQLKDRGFYTADCTNSNYSYTPGSLASALNMNYLYDLTGELPNSRNLDLMYNLVPNNLVRGMLDDAGYTTVAFATGYTWVNWRDADIYYSYPLSYLIDPFLYPFEALLVDTSILRVAQRYDLLNIKEFGNLTRMDYVLSHVKRTEQLISNLKRSAQLPGPKFVYAHILVPHSPFVFRPDGTASWENYFDETTGEMRSDVDNVKGYTDNIQYINGQMIRVIDEILAVSEPDPVIIIQGDHSYFRTNRYPILNVYYFPDHDYSSLYPDISPVNSFRVVFNQFFGTDYPLLEDRSIEHNINRPFFRGFVPAFVLKCPSNPDIVAGRQK